MVRETRHLWVGNLPENIREDRIRDHFKRYGRVQSVKLLGGRGDKDEVCATVSFMDIKSAAKAHHSEQKLDDRVLSTEYHEPAAIPASYSRFHLGSEEVSSSFDRSSHFYERGERGEGAGGYIRRSGYHSSGGESLSRTRPRDRASYRNGPYTPIIESVVSRSGSSTGHHGSSGRSGGGGSWSYESPSPRYPPSTPDISYQEPPTTILVHKKHSKSRSGSDSGSNSSRSRSSSASSQSGSSTCSTASSSPASEKSCSTHSQQSTLRSSGAQSGSANHTSNSSPAVHSEDRRPLAICVRNLPARSSDTSLKDGLYHEYKKHGKVTWVKVVGQGVDRYALVSFKKPEDVDKALQVSHDKLFFGCKIEVAPYQGYDVEDNEFRPFEAEQDEFHPKATRTLFIGNLDKDITTQEIRKHFDQFGEIIDIDIKKQGSSSSYAFCQFSDIASVVRAMRSLDGEHVGGNRVKLGFGKSMHTNCVWADGVAESVSEKYLSQQFGQFGLVSHVVIDRARGQALITFEQIQYAQLAVKEMRGVVVRGRKLQVDYASRECQESFYDHMEKQSTTSTHPSFENSSVASSPGPLRVFESPSSSTSAPCPGPATTVSSRYNSCARYATTRGTGSSSTFPRSTSPSSRSSRHSTSRFGEYQSTATTGPEYERRSSYRSYEDVSQAEESGTPTTGVGDIRHLQKERVSLLEQLEDCTSSGEEGTNRRRCNKHRRSQSGDGSRPGTPLCDERPENLGPVEPRRPRDSRPPDPLSLPLPRFASQVLSPRPAPPSPPASPQTHSSSSDSEPSPEWEERLRSLDEKYEKWSGSRAGLTKVDPSTVKVRHKLLDLDLHELQPSEIVKSVLAKRSVFDEDSKRLENFGEKYEPREFIPARSSLLRGRLDLSPMSSPVVKSPSSPAAKGLQYPFPSHPPVQPTTSVVATTTPSSVAATIATAEIKPSVTAFLTNCTRQFPLPKISSPQAEKCDASPRIPNMKSLPTTPTSLAKPIMPCKSVQESIQKKELLPTQTKGKTITPLRRESSDDKEVRRKSREESIDSIDSVKRDDLSECDKVKDSQITERRKSVSEKRRPSIDIKDLCERPKDSDRRRVSSEADFESSKKPENRKLHDENHVESSKPELETEKTKRIPSDSVERKKETESNIRHSIDIDKKKDVLGVNSEKDRRRNRESSDSSENLKHKKVPENKKDLVSSDKRESNDDLFRPSDSERKKDLLDSSSSQHLNKHKEKKDHQDKRRDSSEHSEKKSERISPDNTDVQRIKEKKSHDLSEPRNSKKHHDDIDMKSDSVKPKESERRKNSEPEISKEHSLFKKVFGFAERTYGHKDRRDSDSTAVKTDDTIKPHKRDHSEKEKKRDKESDHSDLSSSTKHRSRKSPDQPENNRHKERKHSESSEKRSRKVYDLTDDHKQKDDHSDSFHSLSRDKKEDRLKDSTKNSFPSESDFLPNLGKQKDSDRRKETSLEESRTSETDSNDLKFKDGESKKDNEVFFERRKDENSENRNKDERRKESEKYFDSEKYNNDRLKKDDSEQFKDIDKKIEFSSDFFKFKHDRHRDSERKKEGLENCRTKEPKDDCRQDMGKHKEERKSNDDIFDSLKSKDDSFRYRDYSRKKDSESQDAIRIKDIIESKKKEEREKKKDRESQELTLKKIRDEDRNRDEKSKRKKDYEISEAKMNGDHDDYSIDNIDCRKPNYEDDIRIDPIRKEKRKDRNNSWPATIGCKRRLSSQDCLDMVDEAKRSKPERRDSKDSGRSSGSSRKGSSEKHKGYTKLLEEKIKEDKENEQRKKEDILLELSDKNDDKTLKPAIRKEKRNSGEKRKEERKLKTRPRENGTASESDIGSCDEESKSSKRQQHSIFDIIDDEPAYISMYDKVKARSTKNMQKQEEEKRQEKLKEKFHQLKASRAKREEKKRSTSYDEDSDSEKGGSRRSNKLLITSSEDDACSESDIRIRSRKILCDTSEDDSISISRTQINKYSEYDSKSSRKIISDISEDDSVIKHSTPKLKSRSITFETDQKSRKLLSDTSEDDTTRHNISRQKPSRIQSDDSDGDVTFVSLTPMSCNSEPPMKITDVFTSRPVEMNHFTKNENDQKQHILQSSPDSIRRISLDSVSSEQPRKKSHKKKQKKKNYEVAEDGTIIIRKHSSKKEKKKSHRDNEDDEKKSRKKKEKESSSNKREEKFEDIFGPLSDDSEKATLNKWQVSQVYGSDSESERENMRKKEKKRREKKLRELDEAGRALEAKLLDTSEDIIEEPIKTKKKKRKKSRDEKIKHHRTAGDDSTPSLPSKDADSFPEIKRAESEETKDSELEIKIDTDNDNEKEDDDDDCKIEFEKPLHKEEPAQASRQHSSSLSSLLDSPPSQPVQHKKPDIPGFGSEVDENIHETAVKSISETTLEDPVNIPKENYEDKTKVEEQTPPEDKPAPVISQEETEDAVAALLMEDTFGSGFERYSGETPKPDTPVSEPDLQIDTDTEDTFDTSEFAKTPREPEQSAPFYPPDGTREGLEERIMPLACSAEVAIKETEKQLTPEPTSVESKPEQTSPKPEVMETSQDSEIVSIADDKDEEKSSQEENNLDEKEIETVIIREDESSEDRTEDMPISVKDDDDSKSISIVDITDLTTDEDTNSQLSPKMITNSVSETKEESIDEVVINVEKKEEKKEEYVPKEIMTLDIPLPPGLPKSHTESNESNIMKAVHKEKSPLPEAPKSSSTASIQHFPKNEKIIQHQTLPVSHSTVLVHQAIHQSQNTQVIKPLTIQVINPPALKPLEQTNAIKPNPNSPSNIKLSSPPIGLTTTQPPSFRPKPPPSSQPAMPKPIQHMPSYQRKLPSPIPHLVPPHIPVKPSNQISIQTPQLTPISKGNMVTPPRPLIVHTIQNNSTPKQLHVVTTNPQLSPQPLSPQSVKVIRPNQSSGIIRPPTSTQTLTNRPHNIIQSSISNTNIPLLQTVTVNEAPTNKQFPAQSQSSSNPTHLITNQPSHTEKIVNLTTCQPAHNMSPVIAKTPVVLSVKTSEPSKTVILPEKNTETQPPSFDTEKRVLPSQVNSQQKPSNLPQTPTPVATTPSVLVNSTDDKCESSISTVNKGTDIVQQSVIEPKLLKPDLDEPKPLNVVIQDLTLRAANKALMKSAGVPNQNEIKSENSKPIEQVVQEIQERKKAASVPTEPDKEVPKTIEIKIEEPQVIIEEKVKEEPSEPETKVEKQGEETKESTTDSSPLKPLQPILEEKLSEEQIVKDEIKSVEEEKLKITDDNVKPKEEDGSNIVKDENTPPPKVKKQEPETPPEIPETQTPKSVAPAPERSPSEERVTPEKTAPIVSSGRGRGGRGGGRGKRGRGAGVFRGRGRGHAITSVSHTAPSRPQAPADIYEFRDDSEEERPRLILTIKPDPPPTPQQNNHQGPSTRKSRRLQEKDGSRTTIDDTIEDVIRHTGRPGRRATRSTAPLLNLPSVETTRKSPRRKQAQSHSSAPHERSPTPQPSPSPQPPSVSSQPVASPQTASSPATPSHATSSPAAPSPAAPSPATPSPATPSPATPSPATPSLATPSPVVPSPSPKVTTPQHPTPTPQVLSPLNAQPPPKSPSQPDPTNQKVKEHPTPVVVQQGKAAPEKEQTPQREQPLKLQKEEVKPPPPQKEALSLQTNYLQRDQVLPVSLQPVQPVPQKPPVTKQQSTGMQQHPQQLTVKLPPKLQSAIYNKADLKALMSKRPGNPNEATTLIDPVTGLLIPMREGEEGQYVPVVGDGGEPPEKRQRLDDIKTIAATRPSVVRTPQNPPQLVKPSDQKPPDHKPSSPPHPPPKPVVNSIVPRPPKAHLLQAIAAERAKIMPPARPKLIPPQTQPIQAPKLPTPLTPKAHILQAIGNAQAREGIIGSPAPHQGSILTGSVASPPLRVHPQPIVTGASSARYMIKSHSEASARVGSESGCIVVPSPASQAPPPRGQVLQAGLPVPAFEASLHGVVAELLPNPQWPQRQSPPPAHQHSTQTQGDVVQHVNYPAHHIQPAHYVHPQLVYQQYLREAALGTPHYHRGPGGVKEVDDPVVRNSPPLELRKRSSPHDRTTDSPQVATLYGRAHLYPPPAHRPAPSTRHQVATPPHASQVPPQADSLLVLLQRYPVMWQGLLALKNDQAAVQMHFVFGNPHVARDSLPCNSDGSTPPLRISQRMRLEQTQLDGVARKMQTDNEHCMLLALPCGRDHMDVLQQSNNLQSGFITYLQQKQAAGIVNIAAPGSQQAAYVVHIFPACDFANDSLARIAPDLLHRVTDIAHLLIVIATV